MRAFEAVIEFVDLAPHQRLHRVIQHRRFRQINHPRGTVPRWRFSESPAVRQEAGFVRLIADDVQSLPEQLKLPIAKADFPWGGALELRGRSVAVAAHQSVGEISEEAR
jgi:hypothetical protein